MNAFRCARTGLYFPDDYIEQWGRKYGIGLGPEPISEALTNRYDLPIGEAKDPKKTMHPVGNCRSQVDYVSVNQKEFDSRKAVLAVDDPDMNERGRIMRSRQLVHGQKMRSRFPEEIIEDEPIEEPVA